MTDKLKVVAAIREALEHATPGSWSHGGTGMIIPDGLDYGIATTMTKSGTLRNWQANSAYIASVNPEAITTVLDALDAALERVKVLEAMYEARELEAHQLSEQIIVLRGRQKVAVDLLRECVGPLEVSAAIFESDDTEPLEALIETVPKFVGASMAGKGTTE